MGRAPSVVPEDDGESVFSATDYDHLAVGAFGEDLGGFNSFPAQQFLGDAFRYDFLKVAYALGFNAFALGLLGFLLEAELILKGFLLLLELAFDGLFQGLGQADVPNQNVVELNEVGCQFFSKPFLDSD